MPSKLSFNKLKMYNNTFVCDPLSDCVQVLTAQQILKQKSKPDSSNQILSRIRVNNCPLLVLFTNIRNVIPIHEILSSSVYDNKTDIAILSETWLKPGILYREIFDFFY